MRNLIFDFGRRAMAQRRHHGSSRRTRRGWGGLGLAAAAYGVYRMYKARQQRRGAAESARPYGEGRDVVDEGSWGSFPASDPPSTMSPATGVSNPHRD